MLTHPTLDLLHDLGLHGMAKGFKALEQATEARTLEHAEWLGLLLEHEATLRRQKRFEARARTARLRPRSQGMPRGLLRPLSPHAATVHGSRARPRRRTIRQAPAHSCARRSPRSRRLGTTAVQR